MRDAEIKMAIATIVLVVMGAIAIFIVKNRENRDNYCICGGGVGGRNRNCHIGPLRIGDAYKLVQNLDFAQYQRDNGGPVWKNIAPGNLSYPETKGDKGCVNCM